jgi:POT family proton-dependent oligopeptide transporter
MTATTPDAEEIGAATDRPAPMHDVGLLGHPRGLALLFVVEMWERFSFYGMRALLVLYMVHALGWTDARADHLYGLYTGAVYLTPLFGGWLADRLIGTRRSLVIGGLIIAAGHFVLAIPDPRSFYPGLVLVVIGTGFFKPNVSTMVGQLYRPGDARRDAGFTIFYMGINVGGFIAPLLCGLLAQRVGWHWGFGAAGVGMLCGLGAYLLLRDRYLAGIGLVPERRGVAADPVTAPVGRDERQRVVALLIVFFLSTFFWLSYEQAGSSLTLFADRFTAARVGGFTIPSSWYQSAQPLFVLVLAPIFAILWQALAARGREPSTALKIALGLAILGAGYAFMVVGGHLADGCRAAPPAGGCAVVSPFWLLTTYLFSVMGELCISPVGLSYVTKVAPTRYASFLMGAFFLSLSAGNFLAGRAAGLTATITSQERFFFVFLGISLVAAAVGFACVPLLKRLTRSVAA